MRITLSFLMGIMLLGCSDSSDKELEENITLNAEAANLIQKNEADWKSSDIDSYSFSYQSYSSDCPTEDRFPSAEVTVEKGVITTIYVPELDIELDVENTDYPTIEGVFEHMTSNVTDMKGEPTFDSVLGYPTAYTIDLSSADCDGQSVEVVSLNRELVSIYVHKGNTQCNDDGLSIDEASAPLSEADIDIIESQCGGITGQAHLAVCGGGTSDIYVYDINTSDLTEAENLGFIDVSSLSTEDVGYEISKCL